MKSEIVFSAEQGEWAMKITTEGVFFNRERYPNYTPDDFAQSVIKILEKEFTVKFDKIGE